MDLQKESVTDPRPNTKYAENNCPVLSDIQCKSLINNILIGVKQLVKLSDNRTGINSSTPHVILDKSKDLKPSLDWVGLFVGSEDDVNGGKPGFMLGVMK